MQKQGHFTFLSLCDCFQFLLLSHNNSMELHSFTLSSSNLTHSIITHAQSKHSLITFNGQTFDHSLSLFLRLPLAMIGHVHQLRLLLDLLTWSKYGIGIKQLPVLSLSVFLTLSLFPLAMIGQCASTPIQQCTSDMVKIWNKYENRLELFLSLSLM